MFICDPEGSGVTGIRRNHYSRTPDQLSLKVQEFLKTKPEYLNAYSVNGST